MESFDYIIVGAGSAGCVLANRLSADPSVRVLLLEAGGRDNYHWIRIPVGYLYCIGNPRTDWCMNTAEEAGLNGRSLRFPRGRVLGGSSSINGMIYMRGQAADYDGWRQRGMTGWGWDEVLPLFKRAEDHFGGESDAHGSGGEIRIERQRLRWDILDAFQRAADEAGIPPTGDFNDGDNFGSGLFEVTQRRGMRWSAADAFLRPARNRPNLKIVTRAHTDRIKFEGTRAVGVRWHADGASQEARADGEVILSAGAIGSPAILERSGVGDSARLQDLGIETRVHSPQVGENLQDHLQIRCAWAVTGVSTLNARASTLWGKALIGLEYVINRSGPMAMAPSQLGLFARSSPDVATADLEYHVQPLSLEAFGGALDRFPAFTASVCNLRPTSRGASHVISNDFQDHPSIRPNYLTTEADRQVAMRSVRLTRNIVAQPALAWYAPREIRPGPDAQDDEELMRAIGDIATTIFHPVGTAAMGTVTDERLRVIGTQALRVVDASVMPTITSGNTNAPTMMIAEKAAAMLREDAQKLAFRTI